MLRYLQNTSEIDTGPEIGQLSRLLIFVVGSDELYNDVCPRTFIELEVLPAAIIGFQKLRCADVGLQIVEGQYRVLARIQAPQAKVPEFVGSISLIKILPIPMLRGRNINNRDIGDGLPCAVYDRTFYGRPICADDDIQRHVATDDKSGIGDVHAANSH